MGTYEKLYLANNLEALDILAKRDFDVRDYTFRQICNALGKLYKTSQLFVLDQEKTYILLARYLSLYNHLKNTQSDKKFIEVRYGSEYEKVLMQYEGTKKSLKERYAAKEKSVPVKPVIEEKETVEVKQRVFNDEFITCQQLFSALQKKFNILLVDARPDTDFAESRINHPDCINVPDQCISAGLSANVLGQKLPPETQKIWDMRDTYDVIVLFDWNTSSDNFALTKLYKLRSALVDWDLNRNYSEPPVILKGGYLELLQMYPTICTNPQVYLFQKNNELDELLELDNIKYPTESDNKTLVMGVPEDKKMTEIIDENEMFTKESLIEDAKEIALSRQSILTQMRKEENEKKHLDDLCNKENNINNIAKMKTRISEIDAEINGLTKLFADLNIQKDDIKKRLKNTFQYDLEDEKFEEIKENEKLEEDNSEKLKDIIHEEWNKELKRARALKPKKLETDSGSINNNVTQEPTRPMVNRATKPALHSYALRAKMEPLEYMTAGLVGLINIRNTCYMNTAIHCLRSVPAIKHLFCLDTYKKFIIRKPAAIINETALLIREIYSTNQKFINPGKFFEKVCQLEPSYGEGNHEDCMEFFLFLLNHLCEDCLYDGPVPSVMTPKQKAWYNQFEGKSSVFIDLFYHQIRIKQNCVHCDKKTYKFEIESTFMLSVPEHDFTLEELMNEYMADYVIPEYCCSKCKKPVNNQKEICYEPKIMVIVLKRYRQVFTDGGVTLRKVESRAHFSKKNFKLGNCQYQLNAIALHSGNMEFGHYTAAALTAKGWYEFNDQTVRPININDDSIKLKACAFFYSMSDDKDD